MTQYLWIVSLTDGKWDSNRQTNKLRFLLSEQLTADQCWTVWEIFTGLSRSIHI